MKRAGHIMRFAAAMCLGFVAAPASAASFDCAKARLPEEIAVCRNPALSELDTEMGALWFSYSRVPMAMGSNGARRDEAQQFLRDRASCNASASCLVFVYRRRNAALRQAIVDTMDRIFREENR
jgi:uncharacterized protein